MNGVYLALLLLTLSFPLIRSFEPVLKVWKQWRYMLPAIFITAALFWSWDVWFTHHQIWGFNPDCIINVYLFGMPLEEWMFFIIVPYACFFIYFCVVHFLPIMGLGFVSLLNYFFLAMFIILLILFHDKTYTVVAVCVSLLMTFLVMFAPVLRYESSSFYMTYFLSLIPFLLVNGILTALPIVTYNDAENMGIRLYSIPLDDFVYLHSLLFMNFSFYVFFKSWYGKRETND